jgi:hypothetical protein
MSQIRLILQSSDFELLESGAVIRNVSHSIGSSELWAVRALREQTAAHQTFQFRLQLKWFVINNVVKQGFHPEDRIWVS